MFQRTFDHFNKIKSTLQHAFETGDFSFVESTEFYTFTLIIIVASCLNTGLETDYPDIFLWCILDHIILIAFIAEFVFRMMRFRRSFFIGRYAVFNWFDFSIVLASFVDMWVFPVWRLTTSINGESPLMHNVNIAVAILRMLRILRLVRLIENMPELLYVVKSIGRIMASIVWVMVLMTVFLFAISLLSVQFLREGLIFGGSDYTPDEVHDIFISVPQSMFVLFRAINGDIKHLNTVFDMLPGIKAVYILYVILSNWIIMSILTAIATENMIHVTEAERGEQERLKAQQEDIELREGLSQIFTELDQNNSGSVDRSEFDNMLSDNCSGNSRNSLIKIAGLDIFDLVKLFDLLEQDGCISRDKFIDGVMREAQPMMQRQVMQFSMRLEKTEIMMRRIRGLIKEKPERFRETQNCLMDGTEHEVRQHAFAMQSKTSTTSMEDTEKMPDPEYFHSDVEDTTFSRHMQPERSCSDLMSDDGDLASMQNGNNDQSLAAQKWFEMVKQEMKAENRV